MKQLNILASIKDPTAKHGNLGDMFGYLLLEHYCAQYSVNINRIGVHEKIPEDTYAFVGSIIHLCHKKIKEQNDGCSIKVLGCGLIKEDKIPYNRNLRFLGVRGPKTSNLLPEDVDVISDPGLLISKIFKLPKNTQTEEVGFIIHSVDRKAFFEMFPSAKNNLIDNYKAPHEFLEQLSRYKYVVSSSLHGVIFCHAYSIPVCSIKVTEKITGGDFKYADYYQSIGNTLFATRHTIDKFTNFRDLVAKEWQPEKANIEKIQNKQESLIINVLKSL